MRRAVVYARISQDRESDEKGVRAQEVDCRAVAQRNGWTVVEVIADNDTGASSKSRRPRPGFARLRALVEAHQVDAVVAYSTSRLTRRPAELEDVIGWHERHGIALATVGGQLDLGTANGVMLARMLAAVDANEADTISERVKRRALDNARAGRANGGGSRAFGFERDGVTHRPPEVKVVGEVATRLLAGESIRSVVRDLNDRGVPTATGRAWSTTTISKMLTSARTAGLRQHNGTLHKAVWEPLLDRSAYDALVHLLDRPRVGGTTRRHAWTGLLFCQLCGTALAASSVGGKLKYQCPAPPRGCGRILVDAAALVSLLDGLLLMHVERLPIQMETQDDTGALTVEIDALTARLEGLAEHFGVGTLDYDAYRDAYRAVANRRADAQAKLRRTQPITQMIKPADLRTRWPAMSAVEQHDMATNYVARVDIAPARRGVNRFDPARVALRWVGAET